MSTTVPRISASAHQPITKFEFVVQQLKSLVQKIKNCVMDIIHYVCSFFCKESSSPASSVDRRVKVGDGNDSHQRIQSVFKRERGRQPVGTAGAGKKNPGILVRPAAGGGVIATRLSVSASSQSTQDAFVPPFTPPGKEGPLPEGPLSARSIPGDSSSKTDASADARPRASSGDSWNLVGAGQAASGDNSAVSSAKSSPGREGVGSKQEVSDSKSVEDVSGSVAARAAAQSVVRIGKKLSDDRVAPTAILVAIAEMGIGGLDNLTERLGNAVDTAEGLFSQAEWPKDGYNTACLTGLYLKEATFHNPKQHANYSRFGVGIKRRVDGLLATAKVMQHDSFLAAIVHSLKEGEDDVRYFGILIAKEGSDSHLYLINPYEGLKAQEFRSGDDLVHYFDEHVSNAKFAFKPLAHKKE